MTQSEFFVQIERLKTHFGQKNFTPEFVKLLAREVSMISDYNFTVTVNTWIGSRRVTNPPLLAEFIEARLAHNKKDFAKEAYGANREWQTGLKSYLQKEFGVDSLKDALKLVKLRNRLKGDKGEAG